MLDTLLDKNVQTEQISTDTKISAPENANFAVLSPEKDEIFDNLNNYSAVLRFTYGNISFMLTGDAETEVEENILARETNITANILKCGHHGSSTSSSMDFSPRREAPAVAVISCGQDNKYGHPAPRNARKSFRTQLQDPAHRYRRHRRRYNGRQYVFRLYVVGGKRPFSGSVSSRQKILTKTQIYAILIKINSDP